MPATGGHIFFWSSSFRPGTEDQDHEQEQKTGKPISPMYGYNRGTFG